MYGGPQLALLLLVNLVDDVRGVLAYGNLFKTLGGDGAVVPSDDGSYPLEVKQPLTVLFVRVVGFELFPILSKIPPCFVMCLQK